MLPLAILADHLAVTLKYIRYRQNIKAELQQCIDKIFSRSARLNNKVLNRYVQPLEFSQVVGYLLRDHCIRLVLIRQD